MSNRTTTLRMKFLLRKDSQIIVPTDSNGEIKPFLFKCSTGWLEEIRDYRDGFAEDLFEELRGDLHFYEFLIQLFREKYDIFIASIDFEIDGVAYRFSDVSGEYTYWIDSEEPRIIIAEDHGRIEMGGIYEFEQYEYYFGMDKENYKFNIENKEYTNKRRF